MKIVVTGGAGFIGSNTCEAFVNESLEFVKVKGMALAEEIITTEVSELVKVTSPSLFEV
jgi:nucleoside-diphosphate-sugar epimerase